MTEEKGRRELHNEDEIWDYISRNYPELSNARRFGVGLTGEFYHVNVIDRLHVNHTLKIHPKEIDMDQALKKRADTIAARTLIKEAKRGKDKEHDHER